MVSCASPYLRSFAEANGTLHQYFSLAALPSQGLPSVDRLPVVIRLLLESALRNCNGIQVLTSHIEALARWQPQSVREGEIPFVVSRVLLQDFTGVPLLTDLAAMRSEAVRRGADPRAIEPMIPVHLVIDHSVQTVFSDSKNAVEKNQQLEVFQNQERYAFLKWGTQAFETFKVVPPGKGICHQINLEHLAQGVVEKDGVIFPETLVGTDSHTTMINGIGVLGWGVGGIEAEASMLGQPLYLLMPDVVGVCLTGSLCPGITATDVVLHITQLLRATGVVGKLVEFLGEGAALLSATDRATISSMAPEYGATCAYFPVDNNTLKYYQQTGRTERQVALIGQYYREQGLFGSPQPGSIDYSKVVSIDLSAIQPGVSGPRRPQDYLPLDMVSKSFKSLLLKDPAEGGYGKILEQLSARCSLSARTPMVPVHLEAVLIGHADLMVAAITSCTNTSNPQLLIAAGLLARNALAKGLKVKPWVKTLFTPGSRVVAEYLAQAGLEQPLAELGFDITAYGCGACVGNIGGLEPAIEDLITEQDLICCSVLSGNRNFDARIHPALRANFLASPPLVVAYALCGTMLIDLTTQPLGYDNSGTPVFLADLWPSGDEIEALATQSIDPAIYSRLYENIFEGSSDWNSINSTIGPVYDWPASTYITQPRFFDEPAAAFQPIRGARALAIFGDSVTTDHISPAGAIRLESPAGHWLAAQGVAPNEFNTYGSRRGHSEVMVRGTFASVRLKNLMLPLLPEGAVDEGPFTLHRPSAQRMSIFKASLSYLAEGVPLLIFAGEEYGTGSSRDWAAKGTRLLGVRAVVARSFERIHRSNLIGMGILPLQFEADDSVQNLRLDGSESFDISPTENVIKPGQRLKLIIRRSGVICIEISLLARIDNAVEAAYFRAGGILPFVLDQLIDAPENEVIQQ
ncbi:aconitate hydratase AcnA [Pseudomonas frederiksbergensis]|uniref:Aconitate hydratase n=1 Tax=Pseudomonas frederiksbergensis TaxID=104087 RepID=A0A423KG55_9PSED|nr:aconitate hydratase AcnA [Pseudomonas frederiksbergensis]RON51793.1 aconitate hydratase 1 [Pseudomonas frederiksbergensis]